MLTKSKLSLCFLLAMAGCGGATPRVVAYDALWRACQEVKVDISKTHQSRDEQWLEIQGVDRVCGALGKKVVK